MCPGGSPGNNFVEIISPNYVSPANKWKNRLPRSYRGFIPGNFGKLLLLTELKYFQKGPRSWNQFRNLTYEIPYWKYRDGYVISGFSSNPYKLN